MSKEAMQQAMEALEDCYSAGDYNEYQFYDEDLVIAAKEALREALNAPLAEQPAQQEPVAWADECRIELVNAIHFLASDFENALGAFGGDTEARRKAEGDIAHARSIASRWNWNGTSPPAQQEPVDFASLLREAEELVREKPTWKRFIEGTPLSNDIAVWMTVFAQDVARRTSPPAQRTWVGLTDEEMRDLEKEFSAERVRTSDEEYLLIYPSAYWAWQRAIEAVLRSKNT